MLSVASLRRSGLSPVDLEIAAGECVSVTGASGSGKSLLLRAIADLDPNDGEIVLNGDARASMPGPLWRRRVAYLAAESGWWAETVGEHFSDREAAATLLERLGLPASVLDWEVARLSTGERQRIAFARTLLREPEVLLLDEPTSALDAQAVKRVEALLRERLEAGVAVLIATHDPAQARRVAKRRLAIAHGKVSEASR